jgi:GNAT superfamily N-acetyltransferase
VDASSLIVRPALVEDLADVMALHAADTIGGHGDTWAGDTRADYQAAFARLHASQGHTLYVAECDGHIVGTFILSILPGLTERGLTLAELRSVQVAASLRSRGIGSRMLALAEDLAREAGAGRMELTSNLKRVDAHRFYERSGYARSHAGFKKKIAP